MSEAEKEFNNSFSVKKTGFSFRGVVEGIFPFAVVRKATS